MVCKARTATAKDEANPSIDLGATQEIDKPSSANIHSRPLSSDSSALSCNAERGMQNTMAQVCIPFPEVCKCYELCKRCH